MSDSGLEMERSDSSGASNPSRPSQKRTAEIIHLTPITLQFQFPHHYPSKEKPVFSLSCKWLNFTQVGSSCTYSWMCSCSNNRTISSFVAINPFPPRRNCLNKQKPCTVLQYQISLWETMTLYDVIGWERVNPLLNHNILYECFSCVLLHQASQPVLGRLAWL